MKPGEKSLRARTRPSFYDDYAKTLREGGLPEKKIREAVAELIHQALALCDGKCPQCGAPVARYVDHKMQQGPSAVPGAWVQYRCSTQPPPGEMQPRGACDFMVDLKEGEEAN